MLKKQILLFGIALGLAASTPVSAYAEQTSAATTMENAGAYLFEWRPIDCGNGHYFAIIVGGDTLNESNVILKRGYDYAYTFYPTIYSRPWGQIPDLVNVDGVWGIPENWSSIPEGSQTTLQIVLLTNNKNFATRERYIDVVRLPGGVNSSDLPPEVRKYLINADGSDAGAYNGTEMSGWVKGENGQWRYKKADGTFVNNGWLTIDEKSYYMNPDGIMLTDTITPDGIYVNSKGEKTAYIPGWVQNDRGWKYVLKNGYYAASAWVKDIDDKWYYFDIGGYMVTDEDTPDGYYIGADGVWDGQPSKNVNTQNLGPGATSETAFETWEQSGDNWKYRLSDGSYVTNAWKQVDGKWYYFDGDSLMVTNQTTPDGYYVGEDGVWNN